MPTHVIAHALLMTLMVASTIAGVVFARRKGIAWLIKHRIAASAGAALGIAGAATMAVAKHLNGWPHLTSTHSRVGVAATLAVLAAPVLGTLLVKGRARLRLPHRIVGAGAIVLAVVAAALKTIAP